VTGRKITVPADADIKEALRTVAMVRPAGTLLHVMVRPDGQRLIIIEE